MNARLPYATDRNAGEHDNDQVINDVTQLNPTRVWGIAKPTTAADVQDIVRRTTGTISIGGGHFSMGGQTASRDSLHIDMRQMNKILAFEPVDQRIRVEAGVRWCDIQAFVDPHDLSVKIMQTYANFTVGGSLSVNVHGRYVGLGPLVLSVRWIRMVLVDGTLIEASADHNEELFYGVIGGYGALGIIVEAELELTANTLVERVSKKLPRASYRSHFSRVLNDPRGAVFHNADLYPPHYNKLRSVTWFRSDRTPTKVRRLQRAGRKHWLEKYFYWAFTELPFGKWRREHIIDPLLFATRSVHWRNYEAGYDVAELEPLSREHSTYVLQEYFVPVANFDAFVERMSEILNRHRVNVINVSVRHAYADPGSLLAWATTEVFAFVLYYKQRTRTNARTRVAVWTRELIDAALGLGGRYYLPYQPHATPAQFHAAYPRAEELFALKAQLDPEFRLSNALWDIYYADYAYYTEASSSSSVPADPNARTTDSEFIEVFGNVTSSDDFYRFLQVVFRLHPEDRMHQLIQEACARHTAIDGNPDEAIYRDVQEKLPTIKPWHADITYALPALATQKREMTQQTLHLLGERLTLDGYLEIGSTGRYASGLAKHVRMSGPKFFVHDTPPTNSPVDIAERGGLKQLGTFLPLHDYDPIPADVIDASLDFVSCLIGLHHVPPDKLDPFIASIVRVLRPGGLFVLRDHDVTTPAMDAFVALVHTVFNCGISAPWEENAAELRFFAPVQAWVQRLAAHGLDDEGNRLLQANDPSANTLMSFVKTQ